MLFVSYSGATRDMLETLRTARAAGAKIILLTHYEDSPGAKLADVVLLCGAQESPLDSGNIPIKVALLYVAEVLVLAIHCGTFFRECRCLQDQNNTGLIRR